MSIQIESDLKEILGQINQNLEKLDNKIDKLDNKVDDINLRLTKVETKLDDGITPRFDTLSEQIREIKMLPCYSFMLIPETPVNLLFDGIKFDQSNFNWATENLD